MSANDIMSNFYGFPFFMFYVLCLSKHRLSKRLTVIFAAVSSAIVIAFAYLVFGGASNRESSYPGFVTGVFYGIFTVVFMLAYILGITRQLFTHSVFITASAFVLITIADIFALALSQTLNAPELLIRYAFYLIIGGFLVYARKPFLEFLRQSKKGWKLLCFAPLLFAAGFLYIISVPGPLSQNPDNIPAALILCAAALIVFITLAFLLFEMRAEYQLSHYLSSMRLFVTTLETHSEHIDEKSKKASLLLHDLRHMTRMASTCLDNGDIEGARRLITSLGINANAELDVTSVRRFTDNRLLDAALSYYIDLAKDSDIDITIRMGRTEGITADKAELAVVLANALENAVKACVQLADKSQRIIRLDGQRRGEQFFLELINTCDGHVIFDADSGLPVRDDGSSGLGCASIAYFAGKYGAVLQFKLEGCWFQMRMLI